MSKNDMLAPIVRALAGVPAERLGVILDTVNKIGGADGELWRSCIARVLREGVRSTTHSPEVSLDTIIRVDRSIRPAYPDWVTEVENLELEDTGPDEYDFTTVALWQYDRQRRYLSLVNGHEVYGYLKKHSMLENCLSLRDGEEIQKAEYAVFRKFFQGKAVILWKSVVYNNRNGHYSFPYLVGIGGKAEIRWNDLGNDLDEKFFSLHFACQHFGPSRFKNFLTS